MNFLYILGIAFALALDAFSVALAAGAYFGRTSKRQKFRLSFHFGLFQTLMPIAGWLAGSFFVNLIRNIDHWLAFVILALLGSKMIYDGIIGKEEEIRRDITRGFSLISLSVATSLDALAVGLSLSFVESNIVYPSVIIGIVAASMTLLGIWSGEKLSLKIGGKAIILGGIVLILIGLHILAEHLKIFG